jgi:O-antigen/teichoic acid export membrane protein
MSTTYASCTSYNTSSVVGNYRRLTLRMNFAWTLSGNLIYAASQWGILVMLAKLGTAQMVGEFALALAITAPIVIGTGLSLRGVQATDATAEHHFGDYLSLRIVTTGAAELIIIGVVLFSGYGWHTAGIILVVGLAKGFESISDVFYGLLQQHERMDRIALSMVIKGLLSLAMVAIAMYFRGDVLLGVCGLAAAWALLLILFDARNGAIILRQASGLSTSSDWSSCLRHLVRVPWRPRSIVSLTMLALPVGIVTALISLNCNIPGYFIQYSLGTRELGIFAALTYPLVAGARIVNALGESAAPRLARYYASGDHKAFCSLLFKLLCLGLSVAIGAVVLIWLVGRPMLLLLYRPEYSDHVGIFLWLGIAAGMGYVTSLLNYAMTAARYLRSQLPVYLIVILATAAGCAALIPQYGLFGAAIAMILATICQGAGSTAVIVHASRSLKAKKK